MGEKGGRFDNAKVGLCRRRGAMSETLHGESPKVGARALQGLGRGAKGRGGQTEMGSHAVGTVRGDTAQRGTKKARPRGADRAGGGLGAEVT